MFKVTATDRAGNVTTKDVAYMINSADVTATPVPRPGDAGAEPGTPPAFGAFTPGVAASTRRPRRRRDLDGRQRAVEGLRPELDNTGKLVNGTFALANTLQASAAGAGGSRRGGGGGGPPTSLLTYQRRSPTTR